MKGWVIAFSVLVAAAIFIFVTWWFFEPDPSLLTYQPAAKLTTNKDSVSATTTQTQIVTIYFSRLTKNDCRPVSSVIRETSNPDLLAGALEEMLKGLTPKEKQNGLFSFFSSSTAGFLNSVRLDSNGTAYIDFKNFSSIIPNASSSCGSASLLAEIGRTVHANSRAEKMVLSFDGSKADFYNWLQIGCDTDEPDCHTLML